MIIGKLYIDSSVQKWAKGATLFKNIYYANSDQIEANGKFRYKFSIGEYKFFWRIG